MIIGDSSGYATAVTPPIVDTKNLVRWDYEDYRIHASMYDSQVAILDSSKYKLVQPEEILPDGNVNLEVYDVQYDNNWYNYYSTTEAVQTTDTIDGETVSVLHFENAVGSGGAVGVGRSLNQEIAQSLYDNGGVISTTVKVNRLQSTDASIDAQIYIPNRYSPDGDARYVSANIRNSSYYSDRLYISTYGGSGSYTSFYTEVNATEYNKVDIVLQAGLETYDILVNGVAIAINLQIYHRDNNVSNAVAMRVGNSLSI